MHRYQPRFHIVYLPQNGIKEEREYLNFRAFVFPETSFTAVTAYQNQRVSMTRVSSLLAISINIIMKKKLFVSTFR